MKLKGLLLVSLALVTPAHAESIAITPVNNTPMSPCPTSPNCVNSDSTTKRHGIAPITPTHSLSATWRDIANYITKTDGLKLVEHTDTLIRAEATSSLLKFVDDMVFEKRPSANHIAVRSESRKGYYDFGANRKRIEKLRTAISKK